MKDLGVVRGSFIDSGVRNQVWHETPEFVDELHDLGYQLITPSTFSANGILACGEPLTSLDDLADKQIRVSSSVQYEQVEALGAIPVSVPFSDLYESLQRGIVDCLVLSATAMLSAGGAIEVAPHIIGPEGTAFGSSAGFDVVGPVWEDLPLAAQQLIFDALSELHMQGVVNEVTLNLGSLAEKATENGGGVHNFDAEVNSVLKSHNDSRMQEALGREVWDGEAYLDRFNSAYSEWATLMEDAGYAEGRLSEIEQWFDPDLDVTAYEEAYIEKVIIPNRPS